MKKIIVFSVIFGLVSLALIIFGVYPLSKGIKKNSEELIVQRKELILAEAGTGKLNRLKEISKKIEPDLEKINGLFIDPEIPIDLIKFFEKTAQDSKLLMDISLAGFKTAENDPWGSLGFQIILAGSFSNFSKFLEKIENGPYLIEIQNLAIKRLTEEEIRATLAIKVFAQEK